MQTAADSAALITILSQLNTVHSWQPIALRSV